MNIGHGGCDERRTNDVGSQPESLSAKTTTTSGSLNRKGDQMSSEIILCHDIILRCVTEIHDEYGCDGNEPQEANFEKQNYWKTAHATPSPTS